MERHSLFGLIEILFALGLLLGFAVTQIRFTRKGRRRPNEEAQAAKHQDEPPTGH